MNFKKEETAKLFEKLNIKIGNEDKVQYIINIIIIIIHFGVSVETELDHEQSLNRAGKLKIQNISEKSGK